ncbi:MULTISPECIES: glycosyltransferase family 2 protein [Paenibacillus]|uniref:Glycosyl transferase family 2 n=1 Tax=Paenibacillus odorifer TaxID=189426 RepID=A0AAD0P5W3_9BACL|nr:glycosyltransferase family 2 protein [Paenibacillus odorifer]AIQ76760.1 glycosyl transferase family 2 [Paenibacillus odorifer]AWV36043.1 glycosyl transferase family 2 [Paenibacillus odorifer]MEC0133112.1 glycosyltransferase family 2 protein [Paenibacillus odorifer]MEC0223547.1 glycosyltransferase family 2 protein [Paenibacillus odorifer]OMC92916.1 glycosyl transferase family 2 [Paenibacillus odorifer]
MNKKKILLIIPAYNEEDNILRLLNNIKATNIPNSEILVINDCSADTTSRMCKNIGVSVVDLPCNLGIGGAVQTGYKYAHNFGFDIAIQVDGDGQHNPKYISKLIEPLLNDEADLVIGSRYIEKTGFQSSRIRRIGINYFSNLLLLLTNQVITDPTSGFRACNKGVIELFSKRYPTDYPEPESIMYLKRNGFSLKEVPVEMKSRQGGKSSITKLKSVYYMLKVSLAILIDKMRKQIV